MREKVVCAEGNTASEAESRLNERLVGLGPNFHTLAVQAAGVTVGGKPVILLTALVQLTAENNIGYWPLNNLDLTREQCKEVVRLVGPQVANVRDLTVTCGIRKTLGKNKPLLRAVTSALGKHGLKMPEN